MGEPHTRGGGTEWVLSLGIPCQENVVTSMLCVENGDIWCSALLAYIQKHAQRFTNGVQLSKYLSPTTLHP